MIVLNAHTAGPWPLASAPTRAASRHSLAMVAAGMVARMAVAIRSTIRRTLPKPLVRKTLQSLPHELRPRHPLISPLSLAIGLLESLPLATLYPDAVYPVALFLSRGQPGILRMPRCFVLIRHAPLCTNRPRSRKTWINTSKPVTIWTTSRRPYAPARCLSAMRSPARIDCTHRT